MDGQILANIPGIPHPDQKHDRMKLLKQLCEIPAPSGEEYRMKEFLLKYIQKEKKNWKTKPEIFHGEEFQDCIIL
jgi:hypothetical protein